MAKMNNAWKLIVGLIVLFGLFVSINVGIGIALGALVFDVLSRPLRVNARELHERKRWDETIEIPMPNGSEDLPDVQKVASNYLGRVSAIALTLAPFEFAPEKAIIRLRYKGSNPAQRLDQSV